MMLVAGAATALTGSLAMPSAAATDTFAGRPPLQFSGAGSRSETSVSIQFRTNPQPLIVTTHTFGQPPRSVIVQPNDHRRREVIQYLPDGQRFDITITGDPRPIIGTLNY